ncbi:molybdopterin-containing oxidoreductase family protein [Pseudonocardia sp. GCM10023141]|uniref:molybdopterin-containing oxidoreductase family protein n=1 Tax=Pseudonocardia sp. GCM10023141 TaxID=3252653 RepID=UPI0036221D91
MKLLSTCRCCSAGCGIVAEVVDGRLVDVRGDRDHPLSQGYLCPKGRALPWSHARPDRLDHPMVRGKRVTWSEALDDLAGKLAGLIATHGAGCIGTFRGHGGHADKSGIAALSALLTALGSDQRYSVSTIDIAPMLRVAQIVAGTAAALPRWLPDDPDSTLAIWLGGNPAVSHGYVTQMPDPVRRIRMFRARGGSLWIVDPRATRTAAIADHHLQIRPGTDHVLLAWLVGELLRSGTVSSSFLECTTPAQREHLLSGIDRYTLGATGTQTGVPVAQLRTLLDQVVRAGRIAVVSSTGVLFQRHAVLTEWLRWVLLLVTDSLDQPGGMWFGRDWFQALDLLQERLPRPQEGLPAPRSRPDLQRLAGEVPVVAMGDEIRAGNLRALFVNGGNPMSSFPDPPETERFLRELDVLVAVDVAESATTAIATHVLPVAGQMERTDLLTWTDDYVRVAPAVVDPGAERRPLWWVAAQLGRRLGVDILDGADPDDGDDLDRVRALLAGGRTDLGDPIAAGPYGLRIPHISGYMRERVVPGGRWNILPTVMLDRLVELQTDLPGTGRFTFVCGRQLSRSCSESLVAPDRSRDRPTVALNPGDAADLGVVEGDLVNVVGSDGSVTAGVQLSTDVAPGVVSVANGWLEHNVSRLCSSTRDVDPLAGQPIMTALPVTVHRTTSRQEEPHE